MASNGAKAEMVKPENSGYYSDGSPYDEVHYLECKLILKPERFTSAQVFLEYGELVARIAKAAGVGCDTREVVLKPEMREIVFLDTPDFKLYNNAFILRQRTQYEHGFRVGDPEIVLKFRHPDLQAAAAVDVRPIMPGQYRVKFKAEALPLREQLGGYRLLYSHNVQFPLSQAPQGDRQAMSTLAQIFPCLSGFNTSDVERVSLVNQAIVEEVLQDLGTLDFGKGVTADANIAIWRERGNHHMLCGEFAFQAKFKRRDELHEKAQERVRQFFISLQEAGPAWLSLDTTKTGLVYRLKGNLPQSHE
jgi:hypothetical protein